MNVGTGYVTTNTNGPTLPVPSGARQSFPGTFAAWGTFGGTTIKLQAGFNDNAGVMQWIDITGASLTAAGAINVSVRCDSIRWVTSGGSGANIGWWLG